MSEGKDGNLPECTVSPTTLYSQVVSHSVENSFNDNDHGATASGSEDPNRHDEVNLHDYDSHESHTSTSLHDVQPPMNQYLSSMIDTVLEESAQSPLIDFGIISSRRITQTMDDFFVRLSPKPSLTAHTIDQIIPGSTNTTSNSSTAAPRPQRLRLSKSLSDSDLLI